MPQSPRGEDETAGKAPTARQRALLLLAQKSRSAAMLRRLLAAEGFSEGEIELAAQAVQAYGYLHDGRLAESVGHAAWRRGKGPAWVRQALTQRAVAPDAAREVLAEATSREDEDATATLLARAKRLPPPDSQRAQARAMRFLLGRGFSMQAASSACRTWTARAAAAAPEPQD